MLGSGVIRSILPCCFDLAKSGRDAACENAFQQVAWRLPFAVRRVLETLRKGDDVVSGGVNQRRAI